MGPLVGSRFTGQSANQMRIQPGPECHQMSSNVMAQQYMEELQDAIKANVVAVISMDRIRFMQESDFIRAGHLCPQLPAHSVGYPPP